MQRVREGEHELLESNQVSAHRAWHQKHTHTFSNASWVPSGSSFGTPTYTMRLHASEMSRWRLVVPWLQSFSVTQPAQQSSVENEGVRETAAAVWTRRQKVFARGGHTLPWMRFETKKHAFSCVFATTRWAVCLSVQATTGWKYTYATGLLSKLVNDKWWWKRSEPWIFFGYWLHFFIKWSKKIKSIRPQYFFQTYKNTRKRKNDRSF